MWWVAVGQSVSVTPVHGGHGPSVVVVVVAATSSWAVLCSVVVVVVVVSCV